jgi:adenine-specific DNA-methyltransferase
MGAKYPYYLLADSPEGRAGRRPRLTRDGKYPPRDAHPRRHPPGLRLRARAAHHAQVHRQQRRDRRDLGGPPARRRGARPSLNAALASHGTPFKVATGGRAGQSIDFRARRGHAPLGRARPRRRPDGMGGPARGAARLARGGEGPRSPPSGRPASPARSEIDASIAARAEHEYLYDKPYEDRKRIRVAGPFTVESLSPHRTPPSAPMAR